MFISLSRQGSKRPLSLMLAVLMATFLVVGCTDTSPAVAPLTTQISVSPTTTTAAGDIPDDSTPATWRDQARTWITTVAEPLVGHDTDIEMWTDRLVESDPTTVATEMVATRAVDQMDESPEGQVARVASEFDVILDDETIIRYTEILDETSGDTRALRATIAVEQVTPPEPMKIGVAGASIAFELAFRFDGRQVGPVGATTGSGNIGCGIGMPVGWEYPKTDGSFGITGNEKCRTIDEDEKALVERADIIVWETGGWEFTDVRIDGDSIDAMSPEMTVRLSDELVRRIDGLSNINPNLRVVFPAWCTGSKSKDPFTTPQFRAWHTGMISKVAEMRPEIVTIAPVTEAMCDSDGTPTETMDDLRGGSIHWPSNEAVHWAWVNQLAPAVADVPLP